jgi:hypothetical protein
MGDDGDFVPPMAGSAGQAGVGSAELVNVLRIGVKYADQAAFGVKPAQTPELVAKEAALRIGGPDSRCE